MKLSSKFDNREMPEDFPVSFINHVYACANDGKKWGIVRATELAEENAVVFCSKCNVTRNVIKVGSPSDLSSVKMQLMETWSNLLE